MQASILLPLARNLVDTVPVAGLVLWHLLIEVVLEVYNCTQTSAMLVYKILEKQANEKKRSMESREIESNESGVD